MVTSTYALRESSKANSLKKHSESSSYSSSQLVKQHPHTTSLYSPKDFYTEKDPQYYQQYVIEESTSSSTMPKKSSTSKKRGRKPGSSKKSSTHTSSSNSGTSGRVVSSSSTFIYDDIKRIRNPGPNDVLCGRGGSINNHSGNKTFRSFVNELKNTYNLTRDKAQKAVLSQSVVDKIHHLDPAGKFLIKDDSIPGGGWWVEVDNNKALAKTSQALREGAPSIRAMATHTGDYEKKTKPAILGKRKSASRRHSLYKTYTKRYKEDDDESYHIEEEEEEQVVKHPLIVSMANGHRGKQLIPRTPSPENLEEEAKMPLHGENTLLNSTVSIDEFDLEDHNHVAETNISNIEARMAMVDANAETPPPPPLDYGHSRSNTILPTSLTLPEIGFNRAHSLVSSELNGFSDSFRGDEKFVNPFLNENNFINDMYNKGDTEGDEFSGDTDGEIKFEHPNVDYQLSQKESKSSHCSIWSVHSDYEVFPENDSDDFYEGFKRIHDIIDPDITTLLNGNDTLASYVNTISDKSLISPVTSKRRYLSKMDSRKLKRKNSSSSSAAFDFVNYQ